MLFYTDRWSPQKIRKSGYSRCLRKASHEKQKAAVGGFAGATVMVAMRLGIARGVFSNESGLGSAPIAAAAAKTEEPVEQGLISMTGTFIDTIIICTLTGLAILDSIMGMTSRLSSNVTQSLLPLC